MDAERIQAWIEQARPVLERAEEYPLIDERNTLGENWAGNSVVDVWMDWRDPGVLEPVRTVFEMALARTEDATAARFVALSLFCQLASNDVEEKEGEVGDFRAACRRHLAELVRLRDVEACTDVKTLRWEIVNACAVEDWNRMAHLFDQLEKVAPSPGWLALRGQCLFQSVFCLDSGFGLSFWTDSPKEEWRVLYDFSCYGWGLAIQHGTKLSETEVARVRDAVSAFGKASDQALELTPVLRCMYARCLLAASHFHDAARAYQNLLPPVCSDPVAVVFAPQTSLATAVAWERAGELDSARDTLQALAEHHPELPWAYRMLAELEMRHGWYENACASYKKAVEADPSFQPDPQIAAFLHLVPLARPSAERLVEAWDRLNQRIDPLGQIDAVVGSLLSELWPEFSKLSPFSQTRWKKGMKFLYLLPDTAREAAGSFTVAVEYELRSRIYEPLLGELRKDPPPSPPGGRKRWEREFHDWVDKPNWRLGLGTMFISLKEGRQSKVTADLCRQVSQRHPQFFKNLPLIDTGLIAEARNMAAHPYEVTQENAKKVERECRRLLHSLLEGSGEV